MGKKIFFFFAFLFLAIGFLGSVQVSDYSCQNLVKYKSLAIGQELPEQAPFTDEILNIYLSGEIYGNLKIENKTIIDFSCDESEKSTYKIYIESTDTINDFINSDDFLTTYKEKSASGEMDVRGVGLGKKVKLFFVKIFLKFA